MDTEKTNPAIYSVLLVALFMVPLVSCGKAEAPGTPAELTAPAVSATVSAPVAEPAAASSVPAAASTVADAVSSVPADNPVETK